MPAYVIAPCHGEQDDGQDTFKPTDKEATDTGSTLTDFISSLDLQLKSGTEDKGHPTQRSIVSILNELDFSSDSEGFDSDILDLSDDESPPRHHTGGKWKPGMYRPTRTHSRGKWAPGAKNMASKGKQVQKPVRSPSKRLETKKVLEFGGKWKPAYLDIKAEPDVDDHPRIVSIEPIEMSGELEDNLNVSGQTLDDSMETDVPVLFHCSTCNKILKTMEIYEAHMQTHADGSQTEEDFSEQKIFHCAPCNRYLKTRDSYDAHLTRPLHFKRVEVAEQGLTKGLKKIKEEKVPEKDKNIECPVCEKVYSSKYRFARHLVTTYHRRRMMGIEDTKVDSLLNEEIQTLLLRQSPFQCRICNFYCNTHEQHYNHLESSDHVQKMEVLDGNPQCALCKYNCQNNDEILKHVSSDKHTLNLVDYNRSCVIKESRGNVQCKFCDKVCHSVTNLKLHVDTHHNPAKPQPIKLPGPRACSFCGEKFKRASALALHVRRKHTKEKPYQCIHCDVSFGDKFSYVTHRKSNTHLNTVVKLGWEKKKDDDDDDKNKGKSSSQKMYKCDFCDFKTAEYAGLRPHYIQNHASKIYHCDVCGLHFMKKGTHQAHLRQKNHVKNATLAANGEDVDECTVCNKKFYDKRKYSIHKASHMHDFTESSLKKSNPDEKFKFIG